MSNILAEIFSAGNRAKRKLGGLLSDPAGTIALGSQRMAEDTNLLSRLASEAGYMPRTVNRADQSVLVSPQQQALARALLADKGAEMGMAGTIDRSALEKAFPQIDFNLSQYGNQATLGKVVIPKELRGQGLGTEFMNALTQAADADGAQLALTPSNHFGGNKARLVEFYKRFGFVPNKGRNIDFTINEAMRREAVK